MIIGNAEIVLLGDGFTVADPLTDHVPGELVIQFRLTRCAQVVEQLGPGPQASALNDSQQVRTEIGAGIPVFGDDRFGAERRRTIGVVGFSVGQQQQRFELGEQRDKPRLFPFVMFRLRRMHEDWFLAEVDIVPRQRQWFGRTPQATVAAQGKQELPLRTGAFVEHLVSHCASDEKVPIPAARLNVRLDVNQRIVLDQPFTDRSFEELLCPATDPPRRIGAQRLARMLADGPLAGTDFRAADFPDANRMMIQILSVIADPPLRAIIVTDAIANGSENRPTP